MDIAYGEMLRDDFDIHDKLNYSVISMIPTELYYLSKNNFLSFVKEPTISLYKSNLITLHPDWVLRKCYINNTGWQIYKRDIVDLKIHEMKVINSAKNKFLYGHNNAVLGSSRSTNRVQKKHLHDFKVNVDLSYLKRNDYSSPEKQHQIENPYNNNMFSGFQIVNHTRDKSISEFSQQSYVTSQNR